METVREFLAAHPNISNALAMLVTAIIAAIAADLGVGEPGAEAVRQVVP